MDAIHLRAATTLAALLVLAVAGPTRAGDEVNERVDRAREVYEELIKSPDRGIPERLLEDCRCVVVFPRVLKAALGFGGRFGKGVASCRDSGGTWSPVTFVRLTGGSWGLQLGAESAEVVLFFMTESGTRSLLESKFTLGAKAGVAAGPAGRTAEASTDVKLDAEIYSYARSKGLFAGISLEGAKLSPDEDAIEDFYGEELAPRAILVERKVPRRPEVGEQLRRVLP